MRHPYLYFGQAGNTINGRTFAPEPVCFVFREDNGYSGKYYGSLMSHEVGHTLGLGHDGPRPGGGSGDFNYYAGHGIGWLSPELQHSRWKHQNHWGPIMGNGETACVSQWCNWNGSPYVDLQNFEDDVAIIGGAQNHFGPAADDRSNAFQNAWLLSPSGNALSGQGEIGVGGDVDFYQFNLPSASRVRITVKVPEPLYDPDPAVRRYKNLAISNLNIRAKFYNSQQGEIANISEPDNFRYGDSAISPPVPWMRPYESLNAYYDAALQPGTYYFKVSGDGFAGSVQDIYPSYGSMGRYEITGTIDPVPVLSGPTAISATVGVYMQQQITATGTPNQWTPESFPPGLTVSSSGLIYGSPTAAGSYSAIVRAMGPGGTGEMPITFTVAGSQVLADALDTVGLGWTTPLGFFGWYSQTQYTFFGGDAARSLALLDGQKAALETQVTGPGTIRFYWSVSSETRWDALRFEIDGVVQGVAAGTPQAAAISGEVGWTPVSVPVPAGTHVLRWVYEKDPSRAAGQDAAWLDKVVWSAPPVITGPTSDTAEEAQPYLNQIVATGATLYGYTGPLIAGLDVNSQTGAITGTPTAVGSQSMTLTATNGAGSSSIPFSLTVNPSPPTALDNTVLAFNRTDAKKWFGQKVESWDGVDSMQSPVLNHSESSTIETTVAGPGTINYYWKANSEIGDVLSLRIGANTVDSVSGSTGWVSRSQSVPAGVQTLRWTFARNASGDGGSNSVWLDRVSFTGATGPTMTFPLTVNWTVGQLYYFNLTSDDPATVWTVSDPLPDGVGFINNAILAVPHLPGTRSFTIFATSSLGTTTRAFTMYVQSSYTAWAITNGLGAGSELGDQDKDGLNNFAELALVLDPFVRNNGYQPVSYDPATKRLRAVFKTRNSQYYPDIKYEVQVSNNLQTWTTIARGTGNSQIENLGGAQSVSTSDGQQFTVIDGTAQTAAVPKRWMRVKVSQLR